MIRFIYHFITIKFLAVKAWPNGSTEHVSVTSSNIVESNMLSSSSTSSKVSFVLRCEQQCYIRSAIIFNSFARERALGLFRALPR